MGYLFFYDETEHSRKINSKTIMAENYYDNFMTGIVGWKAEENKNIYDRYLDFESKYECRKKGGELKSQSIRGKDLKFGFASLTKSTIGFYEDLLSVFDENVIVYFAVLSKIEYVINQLLVNYHDSMYVNVGCIKYAIVKAINVYRPQKVIEAIYEEPQIFIEELREFLKDRIIKNRDDAVKEHENQAFRELLLLLAKTEIPQSLDWSYCEAFEGFKKLLTEMDVNEYQLLLDKEGEESCTLKAAQKVGFGNVAEEDSKNCVGIRMADMFVGLMSRLMKSLKKSLTGEYKEGKIKKILLAPEWFDLEQRQLDLYKRLYQVICVNNNYWFKSYAGIYSDDLIAFIALLEFMNRFENAEDIENSDLKMQPEYYNAFVCELLEEHYRKMEIKLPIEFMREDDKDCFINQRGARIYKNIAKQPLLPLRNGKNVFKVLSVGFSEETPLVTILEGNNSVCYRLPKAYAEWAVTVIGMANKEISLFPSKVVFSLIDEKYLVDIL